MSGYSINELIESYTECNTKRLAFEEQQHKVKEEIKKLEDKLATIETLHRCNGGALFCLLRVIQERNANTVFDERDYISINNKGGVF